MTDIVRAHSVGILDISDSDFCLSPNNYATISITNTDTRPLKYFLDDSSPYLQGIEPGAGAYVKNSAICFVRNSCIDNFNMNHIPNKVIFLNPRYGFENMVNTLDILLCKDANIGESCIFIDGETSSVFTISSGIVNLNFKTEEFKYYCFALLKDSYFLNQLDIKTPRGSTIRHAGERFLHCLIPLPPQSSDWLYRITEQLVKNIAYSEHWCHKKTAKTVDLIDAELMVHPVSYSYPRISQISAMKRIDAAIYSREVHALLENITRYSGGDASLDEFGFVLKRGPNLAKRDLGRSLQSPTYKRNFKVLVYPSDISEGGYLLRTNYIGARNPIWFLETKSILFAAEGTVGKTFVICGDDMKFTTNFHGTIISPKNSNIPLKRSIFLGQFLNYLRIKGIFSRLAVGGQGGSFAVGYWDVIRIPFLNDNVVAAICNLYDSTSPLDPLHFSQDDIAAAGIYELNQFRIICKSVLELLCSDIKSNSLKSEDYYREFTQNILSDLVISGN